MFSGPRENHHQAAQELGGIYEVVQASPSLYLGRLRPRKGEWLTQGYTAREGQSLEPGLWSGGLLLPPTRCSVGSEVDGGRIAFPTLHPTQPWVLW